MVSVNSLTIRPVTLCRTISQTFMDSTGSLWQNGALVGKTAGLFVSTNCHGGGQETSGLTTVTFFAHHSMVYVPHGFIDPKVFSFDEPHSGSPYGCGCYAGTDGSRQPSELEKAVAMLQGKHFTAIMAKLSKQYILL